MAGVRTGLLLGAGLMAWLLGPGPLSPYRRALLDRSPPQLVLVLGGDVDRERMGARLARQLDLPLLVSGGSNREYAEWMLCLLYTSPSPRDYAASRMPSSA